MATEEERTKIINPFVSLCIKENYLELALNAATKLGVAKETIDCLVKACAKNKLFKLGQEAARLGASQEVIEFLVESIISNRSNEKEWASLAFETVKMGASRKTINSLINVCIKEKEHFEFINLCKEFGISKKLVDFFIDNSIEVHRKGYLLKKDDQGLLHVVWKSTVTPKDIEKSRRLIEKFCIK